MAGELTLAQLNALIDAGIRVNGNKEITPPIHNNIEKKIALSSLNKKDGGVMESMFSFLNEFTLSDRKEVAYKGYVDDLVAGIDLTALWNKDGNTLSARGKIGGLNTGSDVGYDFIKNSVIQGGLSDDSSWFFGLTAKLADTFFSIKSTGNTSATYHSQWTNSSNTVLGWLRDDGLLNSAFGYAIRGTKVIDYDANNNLGFGLNSILDASGSNNIFLSQTSGYLSSGNNNIGGGVQSYYVSSVNSTVGWGVGVFEGSSAANGSIGMGSYAFRNATGGGIAIGASCADASSGGNLYGYGDEAVYAASASHIGAFGYRPAYSSNQGNTMNFSSYFDNLYLKGFKPESQAGQGVFTIHNAYIGDGTNVSAASSVLKLAPARGTGDASSGDIVIQRANIQASGTTRHTLSDAVTFEAQTGYITSQTSTGENRLLSGTYQSKSATYTALVTDEVIECTANTFTVNLYTAVGNKGRVLIVNNQGAGVITVDGDGTETINGSTTQPLNQYDSLTIVSNGANWIII